MTEKCVECRVKNILSHGAKNQNIHWIIFEYDFFVRIRNYIWIKGPETRNTHQKRINDEKLHANE